MSKSSEEARQWMQNNVTEDDGLEYTQYNKALEELYLSIEHEPNEEK